MSRYQFEAGDERYSVGYMPELASFFADVEPLETDDELDELVELVDISQVGAVPTLAHLDALLAERGVRIPQDFRELLADEAPASPAEAAMDAVDARRMFFADLAESAREEVRVTPGRMSVTYEHMSGELLLGWDPTFATFYAARFSPFDAEQSEDLGGQSKLGELPSPAALQAALEVQGIVVPSEVFDQLRQFQPVDSAAAVAEAMRRLDFHSTDVAAEAARQVAMTGFATPASAAGPASAAPPPPRWPEGLGRGSSLER